MRILYLMTEPFGIGGVQSDLLTLSEDLTARGHEVHVATTRDVLLPELMQRGARFVDIDFRYREPAKLLAAVARLRRAVRESDIELVAPQSVRTTLAAWIALRLLPFAYRVPGRNRKPPIVTTVHNVHDPSTVPSTAKILRRCSDYVIFESHYERDRLLAHRLDRDKSTVIHSGIDLERLSRPTCSAELARNYGIDPRRHFVYGIVARLSEEKGHRFLLEAFARIAGRYADARLLIVGDGPLREALERQTDELRIRPQVVFAGTQRDIASHLALFDVFCLCSTRESFPLAAREAMAAGRAVIAPRIGGCPEVVDDGATGLLFEAGNVSELTEKMTALSERTRCQRLGQAGRQRAERLFSRRSWIDGDEKVYLEWAGA